jgi:hypothetical protein
MWREPRDLHPGGSLLDNMPDRLLRDAVHPEFVSPPDTSEERSLFDPCARQPCIERLFHPSWYRNGSDVPALANQLQARSRNNSEESRRHSAKVVEHMWSPAWNVYR